MNKFRCDSIIVFFLIRNLYIEKNIYEKKKLRNKLGSKSEDFTLKNLLECSRVKFMCFDRA